jgi:hypothetical protein
MPLLDLKKFAAELAARRNKAALLLAPDLTAQRACAEQIATAIGATHLDLLDRFQSDAALTAQLPSFSTDDLFKLLAAEKTKILVMSGIEFLLAVWISQDDAKTVKLKICQAVELWERTPALLLVVQPDSVFAEYQPTRHKGSQVIIQLSQTLSLA